MRGRTSRVVERVGLEHQRLALADVDLRPEVSDLQTACQPDEEIKEKITEKIMERRR